MERVRVLKKYREVFHVSTDLGILAVASSIGVILMVLPPIIEQVKTVLRCLGCNIPEHKYILVPISKGTVTDIKSKKKKPCFLRIKADVFYG